MLGDGLSIRIQYREGPIVLGMQEMITLEELDQYNGDEMIRHISSFIWENIKREVKYAKNSPN